MSIRIGTSGWSYDDWVGPFYEAGTPARDYLAAYAGRLSTVEIDSTFYALPAASTFEGWARKTPAEFRFAPKVPGIVTHGAEGERANIDKVLLDAEGVLERFLDRAGLLGEKLAHILFQFPYFRVKELSLEVFLPRLDAALARVGTRARVAVEVRNKTWITPESLEVLKRHKAAAVLVDHPYMYSPAEQLARGMLTADFSHVRLLGDRYRIEEKTKTWDRTVEDKSERLLQWAEVIRTIAARAEVRDVYAFSNNHFAGHAPATCVELAQLLGVSLKLEG